MQSRFILFWLLGLFIVSRLVLQSRHTNSRWGRLCVTRLDVSCTRLLPIAPLPCWILYPSFVVLLQMLIMNPSGPLSREWSSSWHTLVLDLLACRRTLCQTFTGSPTEEL